VQKGSEHDSLNKCATTVHLISTSKKTVKVKAIIACQAAQVHEIVESCYHQPDRTSGQEYINQKDGL